jgi:amino acid adenylation domain-containing protein
MAARSRADVERLLLEGGARAGNRIPRLGPEEAAPLSFAQERMWLLERMLPEVTAYNVPRLLCVPGRLDAASLQSALDTVASRHATIRTGISVVDGALVLRAYDDRRIELEVHDFRETEEAPAQADRLVSELAWRRFDLEQGTMVRAALIRMDDHDRLLLVSHHLVSDHGSARILLNELSEAYDAACSGRDPVLPELPVQYADFAAWQRNRMSGLRLEELTDHWRRRLAGIPDRLDLPFDRPRPPAKTYSGAEHRATLPADLVDALRALARTRNVSFFTVLLAGFYTLLYRYTGMEDIVVGSPISGRHHEETQPLIGYFSNTLALRATLEDEMSFEDLLERLRTITLDAFAHQELPFERLVEALNPERDPSHTPVFQVLFAHDLALPSIEFGGMSAEQLRLPGWPWSRFDLAVGTQERADGTLDVIAEYSTDLFESETIERLIGHFTTLLEGAVASPGRAIGTLPILTGEERRRVLGGWSRGGDMPHSCVHELFVAQATQSPERPAVEGSGRVLTYGELDDRSNLLAHYLQRLGVTAGTLVGICVDRIPETMVAMLGVLKTGAAYVPVEPTYPEERKAFLLADAAAPVLLTQDALLESLPSHDAKVVCIDRDWDEIAAEPNGPVAGVVDPAAVAYVIYTSGSTGRPKGVEIRHSSVVNLLQAMRERPGVTSDDVVMNVTTPAFDLSVPDLYLPLVSGAKLVFAHRDQTQDPARLASALEEPGATFMQATPTTWRMLVDAGWEGRRELKIVCGGEALPRSLANELIDRGASLWHMYGPTETTVWSSAIELARGHGTPPIGGPIANTRFYVVDRHLQPAPIGVPGELLIGGEGVARGYRNRPELTAERFIDDPFDPAGGRVYRTGDRMRFRADGTLEFLGRLDHQVKFHGYRIELGEVEASLDGHPDVRQSVVLIDEDETGEKRLVAYVVPEIGRVPAVDDLRRHVSESVPGYAVPSTIVRLDELPLTANGKLDRKALPRPGTAREDLRARYVAPSTPTEEALAAIWTDLLAIDKVGAEDDFFQLGGHSLLAVKMLARVHEQLGVEIFLTTVFERPTLAGLAAAVAERFLEEAHDENLEQLLAELESDPS